MKKFYILALSFLLLFSNITKTDAATATASATRTKMYVGETATVTIKTPGANDGIQGTIAASGVVESQYSSYLFYEGGSMSFTVTAKALGKGSVTIKGTGETWEGEAISINQTINFEVIEKPAPAPTPAPQTKPPASNSNSSTGNANTNTQQAQKPSTNTQTDANAAAEAAEKERLEQLESEKLTPLITNIDIISESNKMNAQTLTSLQPVKGEAWEFEYMLPSEVDKVKLDVRGIDNDVVLTFDEIQNLGEEKLQQKTVEIRAVKGEIIQEYKVELLMNNEEPLVLESNGQSFKVINDETIKEYMALKGFTHEVFNNGEIEVPYYRLNMLRFVTIKSDDNVVSLYMLNDLNELTDAYTLVKSGSDFVFIIEAPEDAANKLIKSNSYSELEADDEIVKNDISKSPEYFGFTLYNKYKGWSIDEGTVVYGINPEGVEGYYLITEDGIESYTPVFDEPTNYIYEGILLFFVISYAWNVTMKSSYKRENKKLKKEIEELKANPVQTVGNPNEGLDSGIKALFDNYDGEQFKAEIVDFGPDVGNEIIVDDFIPTVPVEEIEVKPLITPEQEEETRIKLERQRRLLELEEEAILLEKSLNESGDE